MHLGTCPPPPTYSGSQGAQTSSGGDSLSRSVFSKLPWSLPRSHLPPSSSSTPRLGDAHAQQSLGWCSAKSDGMWSLGTRAGGTAAAGLTCWRSQWLRSPVRGCDYLGRWGLDRERQALAAGRRGSHGSCFPKGGEAAAGKLCRARLFGRAGPLQHHTQSWRPLGSVGVAWALQTLCPQRWKALTSKASVRSVQSYRTALFFFLSSCVEEGTSQGDSEIRKEKK